VLRIVVYRHIHRVHLENGELRSDVSAIVTRFHQGLLDICQVEGVVTSEVPEPKVVHKAVVVLFVALIDGLIVVSAVVITYSRQHHSVWEALLKEFPGLLQVRLD
jgi:hypothetical protein